jgi:hypothetical protein
VKNLKATRVAIFFLLAGLSLLASAYLYATPVESNSAESASLKNLSIDSFRHLQRKEPLLPYKSIIKRDIVSPVWIQDVLEKGWLYPGISEPLSIKPPVNWDYWPNRSVNYHLHSFHPLDILCGYGGSYSQRIIDASLLFTLDWIDNHFEDYQGGAYRKPQVESFAWYDMAVGLRIQKIAFLLDIVSRQQHVPDETVQKLWQALLKHIEYLDIDENITYRNNHGFYQLAGQLTATQRFNWINEIAEANGRAQLRLNRMLSDQFTPEGIHREHSPDYHRILTNTIKTLVDLKINGNDCQLEDYYRKSNAALDLMYMPDGGLLPFGDTSHMGESPKMQEHQSFSSREVVGFQKSGLFIMRQQNAPQENTTYFAMQAAFHSRAHKHADDLSIVWYDRGTLLFTDPGKYGYRKTEEVTPEQRQEGYWYSDPKRMYVESTRAHTTIEINNKNHDRINRKPYGSALVAWGNVDNGILYVSGKVPHTGGFEHSRFIVFCPSKWLLIFDNITESGTSKTRNFYRQWFQLGPQLSATKGGQVYTITGESLTVPLSTASFVSDVQLDEPFYGQVDPCLQGWHSPIDGAFEPITSLCFNLDVTGGGTFVTLFSFSKDILHKSCSLESNNSIGGEFKWIDAYGQHAITIKGANRNDPYVRYMRKDLEKN